MKYAIKKEIYQAILNCLVNYEVTDLTSLESTFFAEECHILGQPNPEDWLNSHGLSVWDAIPSLNAWKEETSGESLTPQELNPRTVVNLLVCGYASELILQLISFFETVEELAAYLKSEVGSGGVTLNLSCKN